MAKNSPGFSGFSDTEINKARDRGEELRDKIKAVTQPQLTSKASQDAKVKEGPKLGDGTFSRVKIFLLDENPSQGFSFAKIPKSKTKQVLARYFFHLLQDTERTDNANPYTVAT